VLSFLCLLLGCVCPAYADGAHIALRAVSGPYSVTLFTAPEPLVSGPADLSVLVEDAATGAVLSEATAEGVLSCAGAGPVRMKLSHEAAANKLLLAANPTIAQTGSCTLVLHIGQPGSPTVSVSAVLRVGEDHRRRTVLLFALVLPVLVIVLFLVNQQVKFRRAD
jgi:hypothetical protein